MLYFLNREVTTENMRFFLGQLKCQKCGRCCKGETCDPAGAVLKNGELEALAIGLNISKSQFKQRYTIIKDSKRLIKFPCAFLGDQGCTIYPHRPQVCRQFPFNQSITRNGKKWMMVADCPGGKVIGEKYGVKV